jgi:hypothetical protein
LTTNKEYEDEDQARCNQNIRLGGCDGRLAGGERFGQRASKGPSTLGREFQGSLCAYTDNRAGQSAARYIQGVLPALGNARDIARGIACDNACDNAVVMPAEAGGWADQTPPVSQQQTQAGCWLPATSFIRAAAIPQITESCGGMTATIVDTPGDESTPGTASRDVINGLGVFRSRVFGKMAMISYAAGVRIKSVVRRTQTSSLAMKQMTCWQEVQAQTDVPAAVAREKLIAA